MSETSREATDADTAVTDEAGDAADRARAEVLARHGIESSKFLLRITYDPDSTKPFRFRKLSYSAGPATWETFDNVMSYTNCYGGNEGIIVWNHWSRVYHAIGRPLGFLSVLAFGHMTELRDVETVRMMHELDMGPESPMFFV